MKKSMQFIKNVIVMTGCAFLLRFLGVSFSVYLSNRIGAEAMGTYHLVLSVYFFSVTVATSGIGLTVTKLVSEELAKGHRVTLLALVQKSLRYCLICSSIAGGFLIGLAPFLVKAVFGETISTMPFYILAIGLPFISVSSALSGYLIALRKSGRSSFGQLTEQVVKMGATVWLLSLADATNLTEISCALVFGGTASEIVSCGYYYMTYRLQETGYKPQNQKGQWRRILRFSVPVALSSYFRSGLSSVKQLLVPKRLQSAGISNGIAEYGRVNGMVFPILMFPQVFLSSFASLLVPEITEKYTLRQNKALKRILSRIFRITLIFSVGVAGILLCYAEKLSLFFYKNSEAAAYLKLLAPLVVIMYLDDIVDAVLKGINCQVTVVKINILDSAVGIGLLWYLLPVYGIRGYLTVIAVGEILNGTLSIITLIRHTDCSFELFRNVLCPAMMISLSVWCGSVLAPNGLWNAIGVTVFLYVCLLYATGLVSYQDLKL